MEDGGRVSWKGVVHIYVGGASHMCTRPGVVGAMGTDLARTNPLDHFPNSGYTGSTVFLVVQV